MNLDILSKHLDDAMDSVVSDKIENLRVIKGGNYADAVHFAFKIIMFQSSSVAILQICNLKREVAMLMDMLHEKALFNIIFSHFSVLGIEPEDAPEILETAHAMVEAVENQAEVGFKLAQA